jgi:sterol desaturase/sphingolipid hydroxylase (fatty acid hydroxylase superfamily)
MPAMLPGETVIRLASFLGVFAAVAGGEILFPRRRLTTAKKARWCANLSIVALDTVLARFLLPVLPVAMAAIARDRGWGFLNSLAWPSWLEAVAAIVLLDLVIYAQHVLFHYVPLFWRLHRMHHTDLDIDVTTGNRFHPLEIILSLGIKLGAVVLLGASPVSVLLFEVILNATSMFNHGNLRIPAPLDRWLRLFLVTPDMHRVHHSVIPRETNSNFGFNLPWWDRLCGTYRPQPELGHEGMTIGLAEFRDPALLTLPRLLVQPFLRIPR